MNIEKYRVPEGSDTIFSAYETCEETKFSDQEIKEELIPEMVDELQDLQLKFHAEEKRGITIVLQAMDAAGKDEIIGFIYKHLLPQGLKISSSKKPSEEEKKHDFLWRIPELLPERGQIAVLNRSYYEDVLALMVKDGEGTVPVKKEIENKEDWELRLEQINSFEKYLWESGFPVIKIFPYVSKEVQKERILERMKNPAKNWEFSFSDIEDRKKWDLFHDSYEKIIQKTSTKWAPWYILPADNAWYSRLLAGIITVDLLKKIDPQFPVIKGEEKERLDKAIEELEKE